MKQNRKEYMSSCNFVRQQLTRQCLAWWLQMILTHQLPSLIPGWTRLCFGPLPTRSILRLTQSLHFHKPSSSPQHLANIRSPVGTSKTDVFLCDSLQFISNKYLYGVETHIKPLKIASRFTDIGQQYIYDDKHTLP